MKATLTNPRQTQIELSRATISLYTWSNYGTPYKLVKAYRGVNIIHYNTKYKQEHAYTIID